MRIRERARRREGGERTQKGGGKAAPIPRSAGNCTSVVSERAHLLFGNESTTTTSEEHLLELQRQFFESKKAPSARVVRRGQAGASDSSVNNEKRRPVSRFRKEFMMQKKGVNGGGGEAKKGLAEGATRRVQKDIVRLGGLPPRPPPPPEIVARSKGKDKKLQEKEGKKNGQQDPMERLDKYDERTAPERVLVQVLRDIRENTSASEDSYRPPVVRYEQGFPSAFLAESNHTQGEGERQGRALKAKKKSRFALEMQRMRALGKEPGRIGSNDGSSGEKKMSNAFRSSSMSHEDIGAYDPLAVQGGEGGGGGGGGGGRIPSQRGGNNKKGVGTGFHTTSNIFDLGRDGDVNERRILSMTDMQLQEAKDEIERLLGADTIEALKSAPWTQKHLPIEQQQHQQQYGGNEGEGRGEVENGGDSEEGTSEIEERKGTEPITVLERAKLEWIQPVGLTPPSLSSSGGKRRGDTKKKLKHHHQMVDWSAFRVDFEGKVVVVGAVGHSDQQQPQSSSNQAAKASASSLPPSYSGLYHHGDHPELPGWRGMALRVLAAVLARARRGKFYDPRDGKKPFSRNVISKLFDLGLPTVLRLALDENVHMPNLLLALRCLEALLAEPGGQASRDEGERKSGIRGLFGGYLSFSLAPRRNEATEGQKRQKPIKGGGGGATRSTRIASRATLDVDDENFCDLDEDDDDDDVEGGEMQQLPKGEKDLKACRKDLVLALVSRMSLLERLRYILEVLAFPLLVRREKDEEIKHEEQVEKKEKTRGKLIASDSTSSSSSSSTIIDLASPALRILHRISLHSLFLRKRMVISTPRLLKCLSLYASPTTSHSKLSALALKVLGALAQASPACATKILSTENIANSSKGFIALQASSSKGVEQYHAPALEAWRLWEISVIFGLDTGAILSFSKQLVKILGDGISLATSKRLFTTEVDNTNGAVGKDNKQSILSESATRNISLAARAALNLLSAGARLLRRRSSTSASSSSSPLRWSHLGKFLQQANAAIIRGGILQQKQQYGDKCSSRDEQELLNNHAVIAAGVLHFLAECGEARAETLVVKHSKSATSPNAAEASSSSWLSSEGAAERKVAFDTLKRRHSDNNGCHNEEDIEGDGEGRDGNEKRARTEQDHESFADDLPIALDLLLGLVRYIRALQLRWRAVTERLSSEEGLVALPSSSLFSSVPSGQRLLGDIKALLSLITTPSSSVSSSSSLPSSSLWGEHPPPLEWMGRLGALLAHGLLELLYCVVDHGMGRSSSAKKKDKAYANSGADTRGKNIKNIEKVEVGHADDDTMMMCAAASRSVRVLLVQRLHAKAKWTISLALAKLQLWEGRSLLDSSAIRDTNTTASITNKLLAESLAWRARLSSLCDNLLELRTLPDIDLLKVKHNPTTTKTANGNASSLSLSRTVGAKGGGQSSLVLYAAAPSWVSTAIPGYGWILAAIQRGIPLAASEDPPLARQFVADMLDLLLSTCLNPHPTRKQQQSSQLKTNSTAKEITEDTFTVLPLAATPRAGQSALRAIMQFFLLSSDIWSAPEVRERLEIGVDAALTGIVTNHYESHSSSIAKTMLGFLHPQFGPFFPLYSELLDAFAYDGVNSCPLERILMLFIAAGDDEAHYAASEYRRAFWRRLEPAVLLRLESVPPLQIRSYLDPPDTHRAVLARYVVALTHENFSSSPYMYQIALHHIAHRLFGATRRTSESGAVMLLSSLLGSKELRRKTVLDLLTHLGDGNQDESDSKENSKRRERNNEKSNGSGGGVGGDLICRPSLEAIDEYRCKCYCGRGRTMQWWEISTSGNGKKVNEKEEDANVILRRLEQQLVRRKKPSPRMLTMLRKWLAR
eukprot:jgi/Bigna1/76804/fgenesh1_pg.44_\